LYTLKTELEFKKHQSSVQFRVENNPDSQNVSYLIISTLGFWLQPDWCNTSWWIIMSSTFSVLLCGLKRISV